MLGSIGSQRFIDAAGVTCTLPKALSVTLPVAVSTLDVNMTDGYGAGRSVSKLVRVPTKSMFVVPGLASPQHVDG